MGSRPVSGNLGGNTCGNALLWANHAPLVQSSDLGDAPMKSDCGKLFGAPSLRLLSHIIGGFPPLSPDRPEHKTPIMRLLFRVAAGADHTA